MGVHKLNRPLVTVLDITTVLDIRPQFELFSQKLCIVEYADFVVQLSQRVGDTSREYDEGKKCRGRDGSLL